VRVRVVVSGERDIGAHLQRPIHDARLVVYGDPPRPVGELRVVHVVDQQVVHAAQVVRELEAVVAQKDDRVLALEPSDRFLERD
jgi:hypothetical protein